MFNRAPSNRTPFNRLIERVTKLCTAATAPVTKKLFTLGKTRDIFTLGTVRVKYTLGKVRDRHSLGKTSDKHTLGDDQVKD